MVSRQPGSFSKIKLVRKLFFKLIKNEKTSKLNQNFPKMAVIDFCKIGSRSFKKTDCKQDKCLRSFHQRHFEK